MNFYLPRLAEKKLTQKLQSKKVVMLLGARQVGKTTLLKHLLSAEPAKLFLNLDTQLDKQRLLAAGSLSPQDALISLGLPKIMIIDEAQRLPEAASIVKGWFDAGLPVKIILTGSSSLDLLDQSAESLTGRNIKIFLPPLTFKEILQSQKWYSPVFKTQNLRAFKNQISSLILSTLVFGSYPEIFISEDKAQLLTNLTSDYLLKDVLQLGLVKTPELIQKLLALLAYQSASIVSVNELANSLNLSRKTVERYLELLERTFIIFRLPAFSTNPRKEIAKSQKIYFWDTGVKNALIGELNLNPLRPDIGSLWENWIIGEFAKQNLISGSLEKLYFWRSHAGGEVDLVIKNSVTGKIKAYEIKWSAGKTTKAFSPQYKIPVRLIHKENFLEFLLPGK